MPTPARVVVLPKDPGLLRVDEVALPDPGPYQVVVKQFASGICHSQLHQMRRPREATGYARGKAAKEGLTNVQFIAADLSSFDTTAEPEAFDFVTTFDAIHD